MINKIEAFKKRAISTVKTDQDLVLLTIVSSLLASLGIKMDNSYVLIGSMLISPLFDPILSIIVLIFIHDRKALVRSLKSFVIVISLAFLTSAIFWGFVFFLDPSTVSFDVPAMVTWENFLVAFLMGIVGMLLWIWPKITNTSAGVALAISLVPPIAYTCYYFAFGFYSFALVYLYIFNTNLIGSFLGAGFVLVLYKRGHYKTRI